MSQISIVCQADLDSAYEAQWQAMLEEEDAFFKAQSEKAPQIFISELACKCATCARMCSESPVS